MHNTITLKLNENGKYKNKTNLKKKYNSVTMIK